MLNGVPCAAWCPLSYPPPDSVVPTGPQKPWAKAKARVNRVVAVKSSLRSVCVCVRAKVVGWLEKCSVCPARKVPDLSSGSQPAAF